MLLEEKKKVSIKKVSKISPTKVTIKFKQMTKQKVESNRSNAYQYMF